MSEELAMIEEVGVGARDTGQPMLWFSVTGDGWGALQCFPIGSDRAAELLGAVYDVRQLNGRMCVVEKSEDFDSVRFVRLLKPARTKP